MSIPPSRFLRPRSPVHRHPAIPLSRQHRCPLSLPLASYALLLSHAPPARMRLCVLHHHSPPTAPLTDNNPHLPTPPHQSCNPPESFRLFTAASQHHRHSSHTPHTNTHACASFEIHADATNNALNGGTHRRGQLERVRQSQQHQRDETRITQDLSRLLGLPLSG